MTGGRIIDRVLDYVRRHPDGVSDKEVFEGLSLKHHAQANQCCRALQAAGLIERRVMGGRITNLSTAAAHVEAPDFAPSSSQEDEPWYWEGNVQRCLVDCLETRGWSCAVADTASGQHGPDIDAVHPTSGRLIVEVKGYPKTVYQRGPNKGKPKPTNPKLQARHWYAGALLSALLRKADAPDAKVGLCSPDMPTYQALIRRTSQSLKCLGLQVYLVAEDGSVYMAL